uniref:Uncharacterized protein n=1 Tax=Rhizophagus irregularis (strain DAOM 181602 / DAOM 197198 / MUCL 43194) TaxID=747089 RepID=U9UIZ7_RHIID
MAASDQGTQGNTQKKKTGPFLRDKLDNMYKTTSEVFYKLNDEFILRFSKRSK